MIGSNQHSSQIIEHGSDREELPRKADWRQCQWLAIGELLVVAPDFRGGRSAPYSLQQDPISAGFCVLLSVDEKGQLAKCWTKNLQELESHAGMGRHRRVLAGRI